MKYVRFFGNNGYCGTDYEEYVAFEDDISENEIDDMSDEYAYEKWEFEKAYNDEDSDSSSSRYYVWSQF